MGYNKESGKFALWPRMLRLTVLNLPPAQNPPIRLTPPAKAMFNSVWTRPRYILQLQAVWE